MNNINKTLYIPLYGKAYVTQRNKILKDEWALRIWQKEHFKLKGKSKSKWLAYYMAMRSYVFDQWLLDKIQTYQNAVILHLGCGLDSRCKRVECRNQWYDIDFQNVIDERKKYYRETQSYHMIGSDINCDDWIKDLPRDCHAIVLMEGVSMYINRENLIQLFNRLTCYFESVSLLMDCYTQDAVHLSKIQNPIHDVGVTTVYGVDNPKELENHHLYFYKGYNMTPDDLINMLDKIEKLIFKSLFAGKFSKSLYKIYEFHKKECI